MGTGIRIDVVLAFFHGAPDSGIATRAGREEKGEHRFKYAISLCDSRLCALREDEEDPEQAACLWREAGDLYELTGVDAGVAESKRRIGLLTGE